MIMAAAKALAALSPARTDKDAPLLPPMSDSRKVSRAVARAVGRQAIADGVANTVDETFFDEELSAYVWDPVYLPYERIEGDS
jgi:malate dehydrogenase (oxaloacetate-decarboxylating)